MLARDRSGAGFTYAALLTVLISLAMAAGSAGAVDVTPTADTADVLPLESVELLRVPTVDRAELSFEDELREEQGLPPRYAIPNAVSISPATDGTWEDVDFATRLWRLRVTSDGASSINLGFGRYHLPTTGSLLIYAADGSHIAGPYTALDNEDHGELWTPVVLSDDVVIELTIATKAVDDLELELSSINVGYRGFGELIDRSPGWCNIDVVCPEGDGWRDDIASVGVISTGGSTFCTGFMVNNTAQDATPYFMTANHCGINTGNAASLVVYWNYESPNCGDLGGGSFSDYQTGSYFRAGYSTSDFTLVELDSDPDPTHGVTFAGWDRTTADATSATAIHQPDADVKCISFEYDACQTTSYLGTSQPGDGSHVRVVDWDVGTTEPGSSGSPLFDQNHRIVGQLHGGYAACGNDESDWYGRISTSWTGGGLSSSRLSDWLDPASTGATAVDLYSPFAAGMRVTPSSAAVSEGSSGGPFTPSEFIYVVENQDDTGIDYSVSKSVAWITLANASGHLNAHATVNVTVTINSAANSLGNGVYTDLLEFVNETDHVGDTSRGVTLTVGLPELVYSFPMDTDPGWTTKGLWAFGSPTGGGGEYGNADPTSGHTSSNVYGYNLSGDYENSLSECHLTTTAIDCSDLGTVTVKFWRWLNVERCSYDHAYIRVSNDGSSWETIWSNPDSHTEDSSWSQLEYDISSIAAEESIVYLRWTMGSTDSSWQFSGWNIDDVEIWGVSMGGTDVIDPGAETRLALSPAYPNPFGPTASVQFSLSERSHMTLKVYDAAGRFVCTLESGPMDAGSHVAVWDGRDASGERVAAGVYFARMQTEDFDDAVKMVLIK